MAQYEDTLARFNERFAQRAQQRELDKQKQQPPAQPTNQERKEAYRKQKENTPPAQPATPEVTIPEENVYHTVRKRGGRLVTRKGPQPERPSFWPKKKKEQATP